MNKPIECMLGNKIMKKSEDIFQFLGLLDEVNVLLGFVKLKVKEKQLIESIQQGILNMGYYINFLYTDKEKAKLQLNTDIKSLIKEYYVDLHEFLKFGKTEEEIIINLARVRTRELERIAIKLDLDIKIIDYLNDLSKFLFYFSLKYMKKELRVVVAGIIEYNDKILLIKQRKWRELYTLVGGHIEIGERAIDTLRREVKEEIGIDIDGISLFGVYDNLDNFNYSKPEQLIILVYKASSKSNEISLKKEEGISDYVLLDLKELENFKNEIEPITYKILKDFKNLK